MSLVVDASLALAWCFEDEASPAADEILAAAIADGALVPPLWETEVANALVVAERRGRLRAADSERLLSLLGTLPLEPLDHEPSMREVVSAAREHGLTAYDATYLVLAMQHGMPLATGDARLAAAARVAGVEVLGPHQG